jgi:short-subunit dehydrogenase
MPNRFAISVVALGGAAILAQKAIQRGRRYDLKNRTVLITGGSRGLGMALAREFASRGSRVTICARDAQKLSAAREQLERVGFKIDTISCDITKESEINRLVGELQAKDGPLDVLVNNAGRIEVGPLETTTLQDFEEAMATHFWGPLHLMRAVIPEMRRQHGGRIVNIVSIGGKIGVPHLIPYDGSKFALAGLSEAVAAEVRKDNIFVTTVYPGLMRTGSPRNANFKGQYNKEYTWFTLSDSMPLITIQAARAARKIVDACRDGRASLTITPGAKVAALAHAIAPNSVIGMLAVVNKLLPKSDSSTTQSHKGRDSQTWLTRSPLTILDQLAASDLNQS